MPAETRQFAGRGFPVEIGKIDRELKAIWKEGEGVMTHASLVNFAIYSEQPDSFDRNTAFIAEFTEDLACRAIVISANPAATENRVLAWVSAHCHVSGAGAKQACCEQISFQLDGPSSKLIPNIVFSHLDSDLPLVFWWQGPLPDPIDDSLWKWIDRLIFDSLEWRDPASEFLRLKGSIDQSEGRTNMCDLNWTRTFRLREAIAQMFDFPCVLNHLGSLDVLTINYAPGARLTAMFMAGWFGAQLGWTLEELGSSATAMRFSDAEGNPIKAILNEVPGNIIGRVWGERGEGFFNIEWKPDATYLEVNVQLHPDDSIRKQMLPASKVDAIDLISEELTRGGKHCVYLKVLNYLAPVLHFAKA